MSAPSSNTAVETDSPMVGSGRASVLLSSEEAASSRRTDRCLRNFLAFFALFFCFFFLRRSISPELLSRNTRGTLGLFRFLRTPTVASSSGSARGGSKAECHELESSGESRAATPAITAVRISIRLRQNKNLPSTATMPSAPQQGKAELPASGGKLGERLPTVQR